MEEVLEFWVVWLDRIKGGVSDFKNLTESKLDLLVTFGNNYSKTSQIFMKI